MERLTYDFCVNENHCWQVHGADNELCQDVCKEHEEAGCKCCPIGKAIDRLAAYEDTGLEPEEIKKMRGEMVTCYDEGGNPYAVDAEGSEAKHIIDLLAAEAQGWLVVLPFKVGDTVWVVFDDSTRKAVYETRVQGISITTRNTAILNFGGYPVQYAWASEAGKTVFRTREEAEAALSAQEGDTP